MKRALIIAVLMLVAVTSQAAPLQPFVRGSKQAIVSSHQGEPFILFLWSLDCTYCHDNMTLLGKLQSRHRGLKIVIVSTDTPSQEKEIAATLKHYRLQNAESWVFADSFTERLRNEVDPRWHGETPRLYFFDAKGNSTAVSGKIERQKLEQWIGENVRRGNG
jgi:hypothetical protein